MKQEQGSTVLVIDSGIGGMSIVKHLRTLADDVTVIYLADNALFPYGDKQQQQLIERLTFLISTVIKESDIDAVVIGCNTATVLVIDALRSQFNIPFVGVVPAIKTAASLSKTRTFTLIATEKTAESEYLDNLIEEFARDCHVVRLGCAGLADLVEDKIYGQDVSVDRLQAIFKNMPSAIDKSDVVVLGCTHYAYIIDDLKCFFGNNQTIIEPSLPVAKRLLWVLKQTRQIQASESTTVSQSRNNRFLLTQHLPITDNLQQFLNGHGFTSTEVL